MKERGENGDIKGEKINIREEERKEEKRQGEKKEIKEEKRRKQKDV